MLNYEDNMARVTIEDCSKIVKSRFELVALAAQRAKQIGAGAKLTIDRDNDKNPVISLREIAEGTVSPEDLTETLIRKHQHVSLQVDQDEPEADDIANEVVAEIESVQEEVADSSQLSNMYSEEVEGELTEE